MPACGLPADDASEESWSRGLVVSSSGHLVVSSGSRVSQFRPCEIAQQRRTVQRLFRHRVAQREPLLHEVDAQHGLPSPTSLTSRRCRRRAACPCLPTKPCTW